MPPALFRSMPLALALTVLAPALMPLGPALMPLAAMLISLAPALMPLASLMYLGRMYKSLLHLSLH